MLEPGDVLDFEPLKMKFSIEETAETTDPDSLEMEIELGPGHGGTPLHTHPHALERYEVLEGTFDAHLDDSWQTFAAGECVEVEKGQPHTFRNNSDSITRVYNIHQPAMNFDGYFEGLYGLVERGVIQSERMTPKLIIHLSMLMTKYPEEIQPVSPPPPVMKTLAFVGGLLGYQV